MAIQKTIRIQGSLIDLSTPKVMGVINVTPDSFFEGSRKQTLDLILEKASQMLSEGADFLDIGGYSSRPGAVDISIKEEIDRVISPIQQIKEAHPNCIISIDTFRKDVAEAALEAGAAIVNDISGGTLDAEMFGWIAKVKVPYILMHMRGTPQTMTTQNSYENLVTEVIKELSARVDLLESLGVADIIVDPGVGFAKDIQQNFELLNQLELLRFLDKPILVGVSRKSLIYKTLQSTPEQSLNGTTVLNTVALLKGASILRVHDVKEAKEAITLVNKLNK